MHPYMSQLFKLHLIYLWCCRDFIRKKKKKKAVCNFILILSFFFFFFFIANSAFLLCSKQELYSSNLQVRKLQETPVSLRKSTKG